MRRRSRAIQYSAPSSVSFRTSSSLRMVWTLGSSGTIATTTNSLAFPPPHHIPYVTYRSRWDGRDASGPALAHRDFGCLCEAWGNIHSPIAEHLRFGGVRPQRLDRGGDRSASPGLWKRAVWFSRFGRTNPILMNDNA